MPEPLYLDPELTTRADALFRELGLDLSTAVQLFLLQSLREHGLPFTPRLTPPSSGRSECPSDDAGRSPEPQPDTAENEQQTNTSTPSVPEVNERGSSGQENTRAEDRKDTPDVEPSETPDAADIQDGERTPTATAYDNVGNPSLRNDAESTREHSGEPADGTGGELRQAFLNARLIGAPLRRVRSLNRLYSIGEPNDHVQGWREVYVSGDEPFALDFGMVRVELGFHGGGSLRMMDGRLPDEVLEADAVYPRDLSAVFSSVIGQRLVDVSSSRLWNEGHEREQLCLHFANGCTLNFAPGGDWGALWLTDAHGAVMFAPEAVWLRVLDDRARNGLR